MHRISAHSLLLLFEQLPAVSAGDTRLQHALDQTLDIYGPCTVCMYALIVDPSVLSPGCAIPDGGTAVLLTKSSIPHEGDEGDVELAVWTAEEGLREPVFARLDSNCACWGQNECALTLVLEDADGSEIARHESVLLLTFFDGNGSVWTAPGST